MYSLSIVSWGLAGLDWIFEACFHLCLKSKLRFIYLLFVSGQGSQSAQLTFCHLYRAVLNLFYLDHYAPYCHISIGLGVPIILIIAGFFCYIGYMWVWILIDRCRHYQQLASQTVASVKKIKKMLHRAPPTLMEHPSLAVIVNGKLK